jgi:hypothetical protein
MWNSPTHPQEHKLVQPLGRLISHANKTEKQTANCTQTWTVEGMGGMLNLPWRKGTGQRTKLSQSQTLSEQTQERQQRLRAGTG